MALEYSMYGIFQASILPCMLWIGAGISTCSFPLSRSRHVPSLRGVRVFGFLGSCRAISSLWGIGGSISINSVLPGVVSSWSLTEELSQLCRQSLFCAANNIGALTFCSFSLLISQYSIVLNLIFTKNVAWFLFSWFILTDTFGTEKNSLPSLSYNDR